MDKLSTQVLIAYFNRKVCVQQLVNHVHYRLKFKVRHLVANRRTCQYLENLRGRKRLLLIKQTFFKLQTVFLQNFNTIIGFYKSVDYIKKWTLIQQLRLSGQPQILILNDIYQPSHTFGHTFFSFFRLPNYVLNSRKRAKKPAKSIEDHGQKTDIV